MGGGRGRGVGSLNRFYVTITLALNSAVVYTKHKFYPREGFLSHQCNISENIKIKLMQRRNNDETRQKEITPKLKQKQSNS